MIYLIRSYGARGISSLKVGYSDNIKNRLKTYLDHNPHYELIALREGGEFEEKLLHIYLHLFNLGKFSNEWYINEDKVVQYFHHSTERIKRVVWKNREKVFGHLGMRNKQLILENSLLNIYSRLRKSFNLDAKKLQKIDLNYSKSFKDFDFSLKEEEDEYIKTFYSFSLLSEKYKYLCSLPESVALTILPHLPSSVQSYYTVLGKNRIMALRYNTTDMKREYEGVIGNQEINIRDYIIPAFTIGGVYSKAEVKKRLGEIYNSAGYSKTPRAVDLGDYFVIKSLQVTNKETGKRDHSYQIIKIKEEDKPA